MKILILIISIILSSNATYGIAMDANTNSLNVVLIVCDDLNDYVGPFGGHPQVKTPHMNSLAETGVWFSQAHCNIPICNPSRASSRARCGLAAQRVSRMRLGARTCVRLTWRTRM